MRGDDLKAPKTFGADYPVAKLWLFYGGEKSRHEDGVELVPVAQALAELGRLLS